MEIVKAIIPHGGKRAKKNSWAIEPEQSKKPAKKKNMETFKKLTEKISNKQLVKDMVIDKADKKRVSFQKEGQKRQVKK